MFRLRGSSWLRDDGARTLYLLPRHGEDDGSLSSGPMRAEDPAYNLYESTIRGTVMSKDGPEFSFRGLPLSAEQESELQHYLNLRRRRGLPPDVAELRAMLQDMLEPPATENPGGRGEAESAHADAERAAGQVDNGGDPISALEERTAAREAEAMKHSTP